MKGSWILSCVLLALPLRTISAVPESETLALLQAQEPALYKLFNEYRSYSETLENYANRQGFRAPVENKATAMHEILHISSAAHQGYFIDGIYYEPYITPSAWPIIKNKDIIPFIANQERSIISQIYMVSAPENGLGNILDEINAYTHVLVFVCRNEPSSAPKQIANLDGFLKIVEVYLRVLRTSKSLDYVDLAHNRLSSGAIETIVQRAVQRLSICDSTKSYAYPEAKSFIAVAVESRKSARQLDAMPVKRVQRR